MPPPHELRAWTLQRDSLTFTLSTDPSLLDLAAINAAFASDMLYWAKPLPLATLQLCVEQSLCFGLYANSDNQNHAAANGSNAHGPKGEMIGFARLITDYTTFGYLTDVYVLAAHQGRGLGKWMMRCLDEVLGQWPHLRRCVLFTSGAGAVRMYRETLGARDVAETSFLRGLVLMERAGPGGAVVTVGKKGEEDGGRE